MSESPPATDVLIVGSGAAGLTAALNLADRFKVTVLAKGALNEGSTAWAQGGIAAVLEPGDTFDNHVEDTMVAGAGLNDRDIVEFVVENAPAAIERLTQLGVPFATEGNALHLTREGGHSHRRIVHVADATGWAVQEALNAPPRRIPTSRSSPIRSRSTSRPAGTNSAIRARATSGASMRSTGARAASPSTPRARRSSPPAAQAAPTSSPPRRAARRATASRWHGARAAASPTWK
jgi:hypothetical protein